MVSGDGCNELDTSFVDCCLDLGHVIRVDSSGLVGSVVDEEIGVIIFTHGDWYDLHSDR